MFHILAVFFLIASAFIANKFVVQAIVPEMFIFLRMTISGVLLLWIYCKKFPLLTFFKQNAFKLTTIAFATFIPSLLRAYALLSISSSRVAFWGAFEPFITAFYLYVLFGKKLNKTQFLGCFIGVLGGIIFVLMNAREDELFKASLIVLGDVIQIIALIVGRYGWIGARDVLRGNTITPQQLNGITFTLSGIFALCIALYKGTFYLTPEAFTVKTLGLLAYVIVIGNMLAYSLYAYLLKKYNTTFVALAGLSMPLFVHLISLTFLNEKLSLGFLIALCFVSVGIYLFYLYKEE